MDAQENDYARGNVVDAFNHKQLSLANHWAMVLCLQILGVVGWFRKKRLYYKPLLGKGPKPCGSRKTPSLDSECKYFSNSCFVLFAVILFS